MTNPKIHIHIPFGRLGEFAGFIRGQKLALEIYIQSDDLDSLPENWHDVIGGYIEDCPSLSMHAPFMDLSPGAVDEEVRKVTLGRFEKTLEIAKSLGAVSIVFHSGYEKWKYAHNVGIWLERSLLTWRRIIEKAGGLPIAIENIFEDSPENLRMLMLELGGPAKNFGICFDTGHFNLFSRQVPLTQWLRSLKPYITELHVHDNVGDFDSHLPMGEGTFPFDVLFNELAGRRDILYTIEAHNREDALLGVRRLTERLSRPSGL
jgi:sugar phosphate isomerase/epimerase